MSGYVAIEVADVEKTFRLPRQQIHTLKELVLHPLRRTEHDELHALEGISFTVEAGEFFGIVGRNGSGKSTLLKCLAGIYHADSGRIRIAGRLAPFIELGVGFNPDLTARDNVIISAVMMGLTPRQARHRFDEIIDFAELREFLDLKLKNYSSGMQVRLAFAVMVQSDSDILLIDEVLAVGDAAFQQKCLDVFYRLREEGRTIVLVTHDMATAQRFCHRAMLLERGKIDLSGDPAHVARRYLELNFDHHPEATPPSTALPDTDASDSPDAEGRLERARILDVWVEDDAGHRVDSLGDGQRIHLHALVEACAPLEPPRILLWIESPEGTRVFGADSAVESPLASGEQVHMHVDLANPLAQNHYSIGCSLTPDGSQNDILAIEPKAASFMVYSTAVHHGLVLIDHNVELRRQPAPSEVASG